MTFLFLTTGPFRLSASLPTKNDCRISDFHHLAATFIRSKLIMLHSYLHAYYTVAVGRMRSSASRALAHGRVNSSTACTYTSCRMSIGARRAFASAWMWFYAWRASAKHLCNLRNDAMILIARIFSGHADFSDEFNSSYRVCSSAARCTFTGSPVPGQGAWSTRASFAVNWNTSICRWCPSGCNTTRVLWRGYKSCLKST